MKHIYIAICALFISGSSWAQTAFTPGNIVVYKIGDGTTPLSSAAFPVSLDEFTPGGATGTSHPMPTTVSGLNKRIVESGSATSDGLLTRSTDSQYLVVSGYDAAPGTASIASTASSATNRVVGIVKYNGNIDASTALSDAYSGNNFRGAVSTDGTDIWTAGTASGTGGGVRYTTKGSTTSVFLSSTITNTRSVNIFNGQLYVSSSTGAFQGVSTVGSGEPTTTSNTITLLNGFPTSSGPSSYQFSVDPTGKATIYVADDRSASSGGGIQKWTSADGGSTWSLAYTLTLGSGSAGGARGLTVDWSGTNPVLYATTTEGSANRLVSVTDAGSSSTFTTLATAATNFIYRGVALAPIANITTPVTLISFKATPATNTVQLTWATSQEINASQFEVEKSTDGINFSSIGTVPANGNTSTVHNYSLQDANPASGANYYKLKTIDNNGTFTYSTTAQVNYSLENNVSIYPNPAQNQITIQHPASNEASLLITDVQGKTIKTVVITPGSISTIVNIATFAKGQYFVKYIDRTNTSVTVLNKL